MNLNSIKKLITVKTNTWIQFGYFILLWNLTGEEEEVTVLLCG